MRLALLISVALTVSSAFAQGIQSSDPKQRAKAAKEMAKKGSEAIPKLQPLLSDPVLDVRLEAVKAIVEIGGQRSLDPLIQAAGDNDPEVQIRAVDGLVNFYLPGFVKSGGLTSSIKRAGSAVSAKFSSQDDRIIDPYINVRPEVITAIGKVVRGGSSMDSRAEAARAAGILRGRGALPDIYQALRSKDSRLMYECLMAIQKIRDRSSGPQIEFVLRDPDERVQLAAIETTGLVRNQGALPQLQRLLAETSNAKVRRAALTAIAQMPNETSRPLLSKYLNDKDDGLRAAAAEGFGRLRNPADLPVIEAGFRDERKMNARLAEAFALVKFGKLDTAEFSPLTYLLNTLNSGSWRGVASGYLAELTRDQAVRNAVYPMVGRATKSEKIELAKVFAESGDKDSVPVLDGLARDGDSAVAQEGLRALRSVKARNP
jgi:HEAT repeat protein